MPVAHAAPGPPFAEIRRDLDTAEAQLRQGNRRPRPSLAVSTHHEVRITGEQELRLVAMAFLLRALAAAAEGRAVDAGIDWSAAVAFVPELEEFDLAPYGPAGRGSATRGR